MYFAICTDYLLSVINEINKICVHVELHIELDFLSDDYQYIFFIRKNTICKIYSKRIYDKFILFY